MQVPDNKDVANHVVPESCAAHREVRREALTGLTFRGSLNAFARNFPAVGSSGLAGGFQVDEVLSLLLPGSHELLNVALVVDGLLQ